MQHASHISEVNVNCLGELDLTYCLIYLDDIVVFSQTAKEHLHWLCVIFDQFREHNLKLKPSKCDFFRNKISYLTHQVSKDRVCPSKSNLEAIAKVLHLKPTQRCMPFLAWWATTEGSSKGSCTLHNHSVSTLLGKGPAGSWNRCHLQKKPWRFQSIEAGMYDSSCFGFHWLH